MKKLFDYLHMESILLLLGLSLVWGDIKEFFSKNKLHIFVWTMMVVGVLYMFAMWKVLFHAKPDMSKPTVIEQSAKVSKVETEVITPKVVKVYKPAAKKKLNLPTEVQEDATKVVTSAVTVDYSLLKKQTVSSVLDTQTGETITYVNEEPSPWLAHRSFGSASLAYGFKGLNPAPVVRLQVTQDVLQIKSLTFGAVATVDSDSDTFVGLRGTYRW